MADVGAFQGVTSRRLASILNPSTRNPYLEGVGQVVYVKHNNWQLCVLAFVVGVLLGVGMCMLVYYIKQRQQQ